MFERLMCDDRMMAIIISDEFRMGEGVHFFTPDDFSQQLGYLHHGAGVVIQPHQHALQPRQIIYTQEVLFIKKGRVRVDFYHEDQTYFQSRVLNEGDIILLASGGHGFETLEEVEMIEVKQGPYTGEVDKKKFQGIVHPDYRF